MNKNNNKSGFTLIEVLIAMLVLSVGLLGLAGLQARGLKNNLSAYHRGQATQLAYDMADRIRANIVEAKKHSLSNYDKDTLTTPVVQSGCNSVTGGCSVEQLAQNDVFEWKQDISRIFKNINANGEIDFNKKTVTIKPAAGGKPAVTLDVIVATITITWDDNRDGKIIVAGGGDSDDPRFQMSFQL